ncbi:GlxA family transcriptional regulator [Kangiella sp. TOML190]|uniref:GlxA family transcriptional regulator n=1 Tax=Kangiella sp. TOML190 TaxID=2931351 RepID=UPI00203CB014|nr:GlxA family transcriptional regulator [Kangiella sp. TOML190]
MSKLHHIAFFIVNEFQPLDLFGPLESFAAANQIAGPQYRLTLCSIKSGKVTSESGIQLQVDKSIYQISNLDTLVFCGGSGARKDRLSTRDLAQLERLATDTERLVSICTGAFLLAALNLPTRFSVTTHWDHENDFSKEYPDVTLNCKALYLQQGKVWSSAGVTAGIDLSLALIERDLGSSIANSVARQLVVYMKRPGDQSQFSDPLKHQVNAKGRLANLPNWLLKNISEPINVANLAEHFGLSLRQFNRVFKSTFKTTPAKYLESIRLDQARILLSNKQFTVEQIALKVGFNSADSFRRAFERKFSINPSLYQQQF